MSSKWFTTIIKNSSIWTSYSVSLLHGDREKICASAFARIGMQNGRVSFTALKIMLLWSSLKIPSPKQNFFFSGCSYENFQVCNLWLSLTATFSWLISGVYLSKICRHVGNFHFRVFHTPLRQSNPPCHAQIECLVFAECFSQWKIFPYGALSAAIHQHLEAPWALGQKGKMQWAGLLLQKCTYSRLLETLGMHLVGEFGLFRPQVNAVDCWATHEI